MNQLSTNEWPYMIFNSVGKEESYNENRGILLIVSSNSQNRFADYIFVFCFILIYSFFVCE